MAIADSPAAPDFAAIADSPAAPDFPAIAHSPGIAELSTLEASSGLPAMPQLPELPNMPAVAGGGFAGNLNVSLRIFSPGDNGPVTQIVQGGSAPSTPVSAPTTWIWNWHWTGAPGCDPEQPGGIAPPLGVAGWTWNWIWAYDGAADAPVSLPVVTLPDIGDLPGLEFVPAVEKLPDFESLASLESPPGIAGAALPITSAGSPPAEPVADAPESRAGRERPGAPSDPVPSRGSAAWAQAPPRHRGVAVFASHAAPDPVAERAHKRGSGRDISRDGRLIPVDPGSPAPSAAVASAAAAAGAGASSAVLTTLILVFLSFLAGALIAGVGLPRLKPRASRLERPG